MHPLLINVVCFCLLSIEHTPPLSCTSEEIGCVTHRWQQKRKGQRRVISAKAMVHYLGATNKCVYLCVPWLSSQSLHTVVSLYVCICLLPKYGYNMQQPANHHEVYSVCANTEVSRQICSQAETFGFTEPSQI